MARFTNRAWWAAPAVLALVVGACGDDSGSQGGGYIGPGNNTAGSGGSAGSAGSSGKGGFLLGGGGAQQGQGGAQQGQGGSLPGQGGSIQGQGAGPQGQGGTIQGGGPMGGANCESSCQALTMACPDLGATPAECPQLCQTLPPACTNCLAGVGNNCQAALACEQVCSGGQQGGGGTSPGVGGSSPGVGGSSPGVGGSSPGVGGSSGGDCLSECSMFAAKCGQSNDQCPQLCGTSPSCQTCVLGNLQSGNCSDPVTPCEAACGGTSQGGGGTSQGGGGASGGGGTSGGGCLQECSMFAAQCGQSNDLCPQLCSSPPSCQECIFSNLQSGNCSDPATPCEAACSGTQGGGGTSQGGGGTSGGGGGPPDGGWFGPDCQSYCFALAAMCPSSVPNGACGSCSDFPMECKTCFAAANNNCDAAASCSSTCGIQ